MQSEVKVFSYPGGEIQRVQLVRWNDWQQLEFLRPAPAVDAFASFCHIYKTFLVPACPWVFGQLVLFRLPDDLPLDFSFQTRYGTVADPLTAAAAALRSGVTLRGGKPVFRNETVRRFWQQLQQRSCVQIVRGKLPFTQIIPVGNTAGYLTQTHSNAALKVNASFFIMDSFDCATVYDHVGTHFGLWVKDGVMQSPPLYGREALLVKADGSVAVARPTLQQLQIEVGGSRYCPGSNAVVYTRPQYAKTPNDATTMLVIIGCRVAAVCHGGSVPVPASGFVLCVPDAAVKPGDAVIYHGMEDVLFGIQVGNSILRGGVKTEHFLSPFYNIRKLQPVPYPPSLYPMDFQNARAARIALGADAQGKPMLLWAEGAAKLGYVPGKDSRGASLADMARICSEMGMVNAVNLDGGGSAQILLNGRRSLQISDRSLQSGAEAERPVPLGLMVQ
ncbi:MAG: phosphodiester glycosidase family protein [Faecalibacterium sp.]|nr:phosphodiester glycosidase family protein [Faecalibacterium sp.]